jgi:hypothetical protein
MGPAHIRKGRSGDSVRYFAEYGDRAERDHGECNCELCYQADMAMRRAVNEQVLARTRKAILRGRRLREAAYGPPVTLDAVAAKLARLEAAAVALLPRVDPYGESGLAIAARMA